MSDAFGTFSSPLIPLPAENVDTDQIIPARYLKTTEKTGLASALFNDWRYLPDGSPDPDFVLNRPEMQGRRILLAGANFGSGSSREHAPWALTAWGIRAILAPSFADIFRSNALKGGLLPVQLDAEVVEALMQRVEADPSLEVVVDLEARELRADDLVSAFPLDDFTRWRLLEGLDDIGLSLRNEGDIVAFEARRSAYLPTTTPGE